MLIASNIFPEPSQPAKIPPASASEESGGIKINFINKSNNNFLIFTSDDDKTGRRQKPVPSVDKVTDYGITINLHQFFCVKLDFNRKNTSERRKISREDG